MQMVAYHLAVFPDIYHIEWVQEVLVVDVHVIAPVLQDVDDARFRHIAMRHHGIHTTRCVLHVGILLDVGKQVEAKLIESQVHNVDTCVHILNIHHLMLQLL